MRLAFYCVETCDVLFVALFYKEWFCVSVIGGLLSLVVIVLLYKSVFRVACVSFLVLFFVQNNFFLKKRVLRVLYQIPGCKVVFLIVGFLYQFES